MGNVDKIVQGYKVAFIDRCLDAENNFKPEFISNDYKQGKKVLTAIEQELLNCDEFIFSVAFINMSGITPLLQVFKVLEERNIPGTILTTDYLMFSDPKALAKLNSFKNIKLKMYFVNDKVGFHTKGYIFRKDDTYRMIVGSSNLTLSAITRNKEWNTKLISTGHGEVINEILQEFNELYYSENALTYDQFAKSYEQEYKQLKLVNSKSINRGLLVYNLTENIKPNKMQQAFVKNVMKLYNEGKDRCLLISATGTGKTYASAFAIKSMNPRRTLFIVHREQIAKQAKQTYQRIFGYNRRYGLLSGNSRELDNEFLFSTVQMMAKEDIHKLFKPDDFDVIVLDECHHVGSNSYQKIMHYFKPRFWLGMTASPENNNYDIYGLFDHNIAYEIRLQQALEEDLLCPFHYFGITDIEIDGQVLSDSQELRNFNLLVSDERVKYIIDNIEYYGYSGDRVKGLVFCSSRNEAVKLAHRFNLIGYRSVALTGEDCQEYREKMVARLVDDEDEENQLDYIFTVDIFNEGIDVPEINQVVMLRPTQSPVVFVQQLGRGLRKNKDKEYVVILDFIANYKNNFMIPIALSGDRSYNKDTIRRYVSEGSKVIPGCSTIHFDEISKSRIFASIDSAKTNDSKLIKEAYENLKYKLGRIPFIREFKDYGSIDITKIFLKFGSYYAFLKKYEKNYNIKLNTGEELIIEYFSKKLVFFKRIHDILLLKKLILGYENVKIDEILMDEYNIVIEKNVLNSVVNNLTNNFAKVEEKTKYYNCKFIEYSDGKFNLDGDFKVLLNNPIFKNMCLEILEFAISQYEDKYINRYADTNFTLYEKYTYEDVCRLLNWDQNMNAQNIGGYFYNEKYKTLPVFVNYHKADDAIAYDDRFISESHMIALSKHPRDINSKDANHIYKRTEEDKDNHIYLFVRKNKDDKEAKEFYFLGEINAVGEPKQIYMSSTSDNAFEINFQLDTPVRSDIYDYIVNE